MKFLHVLTFILVIIGGLNWLLVGLFGLDVGMIFGGQGAMISKVIYILVGLSAIYLVVSHKKDCKQCEVAKPMSVPSAPTSAPM
ncbi:MAG TPA: DUF378 domain-containing protein [Candidatus Paceibacterota bacterium]